MREKELEYLLAELREEGLHVWEESGGRRYIMELKSVVYVTEERLLSGSRENALCILKGCVEVVESKTERLLSDTRRLLRDKAIKVRPRGEKE